MAKLGGNLRRAVKLACSIHMRDHSIDRHIELHSCVWLEDHRYRPPNRVQGLAGAILRPGRVASHGMARAQQAGSQSGCRTIRPMRVDSVQRFHGASILRLMCIAYLSLGHPEWPVLVAANRDEFHARPTRAAGPWPGHPELLAGQDLQAGGTWLGCAAGGRYALLTNYREPGTPAPDNAISRGVLVRDFLLGKQAPEAYGQEILTHRQRWAGFNLIIGDLASSWYLSNRDAVAGPHRIAPGAHVLSNHLLDTDWPKVRRLQGALDVWPAEQWATAPEEVFVRLYDVTQASPTQLPATGLSQQMEQLLSSPFIVSPEYGTRCSSVIAIHASGATVLCEQSYDPAGQATDRHDWRLPR